MSLKQVIKYKQHLRKKTENVHVRANNQIKSYHEIEWSE